MFDSDLKNASILIVDDQEANIDILEGLLEMQGYTNVKTTTDPREVIPLCANNLPDLILLDLSMPHLSGFEVMEQLNELLTDGTHIPILVLTADISTHARRRALSGGASDFLSKPFDLTEVGLRIRNLLFTTYLLRKKETQNLVLEEKIQEKNDELERRNIELILALSQAESSEKLKAAFINNISHEIRTPLNGILGFGSRLAKNELPKETREEYFAILKSSSDRLVNTVDAYLDIALLLSGKMEMVESTFFPGLVLDEVYEKFHYACSAKNLTLSKHLPYLVDGFQITTDRALLVKVLSHLVDNAIKFTPYGHVSFGFELRGSELEFFVQDTGVGINKDAFVLIFDSFEQEDVSNTRSHEGSGLGLSIAKTMTEKMGGHIWFQSVKGEGSTFYFTIPCNLH